VVGYSLDQSKRKRGFPEEGLRNYGPKSSDQDSPPSFALERGMGFAIGKKGAEVGYRRVKV